MRYGIWIAASLALTSCHEGWLGGPEALDPNMPEAGPPPISGGGLTVVAEGRYAVASDPARAAVHVVDLETHLDRRIDLGPTDEPGRVVEDPEGRVHVVLRRAGEVLTLDPTSATVVRRRSVCAAPRGIGVDPERAELVVACAEGVLARMPVGDGEVTERRFLEPDLRDVVVHPGGRLLVSLFRRAEVLVLRDGALASRVVLPRIRTDVALLQPTVAWRMTPTPDGALLIHQRSRGSELASLGNYYSSDCGLGGASTVVSAVTRIEMDWDTNQAHLTGFDVSNASLVVDGAVEDTPNGRILVASAPEPGQPTLGDPARFAGTRAFAFRALHPEPTCTTGARPDRHHEPPATAVAPLPGGGFVVQYRDPARLVVRREGAPVDIPLEGGRVQHAGHAVFHEAVASGVTCAGCHPEGGEDGHVWRFEIGARRSQTLLGGVLSTAPFHWDGDMEDLADVMEGTFVGRMGGEMPRPDELASFATWLNALPRLPAPPTDAIAVERGRRIFERADVGCVSCHAGEQGTNNVTVAMERGFFQVPALRQVAYHAPYLHDGSARDLDELLTRHGETAAMDADERDDLVAYLRSR